MNDVPNVIRPGHLKEDALARAALTLQASRPVPAVLWRAENVLRAAGYTSLANRFLSLAKDAGRGIWVKGSPHWKSTEQLINENQARLAVQEGRTP